jgi:hypothetical protein
MNTQDQDYIIDNVGAETWQQILDVFGGMSLEGITSELAGMFPAEDAEDNLAQMIFDNVA